MKTKLTQSNRPSPHILETNDPAKTVLKQFYRGMVIDHITHLNTYLVRPEYGDMLYCCDLRSASMALGSVSIGGILTPGTNVLIYKDVSSNVGYIVGSIPTVTTAAENYSYNFMGYGTGNLSFNHTLDSWFYSERPKLVRNYNSGRFPDSLSGDHTISNPMGAFFNMGIFDTGWQLNEATGINMLYNSSLLRLSALLGFEKFTPTSDRYILSDEGELHDVEFSYLYPWEAMGAPRPDVTWSEQEELTYDSTSASDPELDIVGEKAVFDALQADQVGIPRVTTLKGYLGGIDRTLISCPSQETSDVNTRSSENTNKGLADLSVGFDGGINVRSAKSILLERTISIPAVKQIKKPDDPSGESLVDETNEEVDSEYLFSGYFGNGEEHDISYPETFDQRGIGAFVGDYAAWQRNVVNSQGLLRHKEDWNINPGNLLDTSIITSASENDTFNAPYPQTQDIQLDYRDSSVQAYSKSSARIFLTDSGGIVLEDAWGSQIRLERGNIFLSCQGDVVLQGGRNFDVLAPNDINLRAGNCADVSAGNGDLRLKAERNLHMLGGNAGSAGGVLVESRSTTNEQNYEGVGVDVDGRGITLKSSGGMNIVGDQVYVRSERNDLILDGANSDVHIYGNNTYTYVNNEITYLFGVDPETNPSPTTVERHTAGSIEFGQQGNVFFSGFGAFATGLSTDQFVSNSVSARRISSDSADGRMGQNINFNNPLNELTGSTQNTLQEEAFKASDRLSEENQPYSDNGIGRTNVIDSIGFTFRTSEQHGLTFDESGSLEGAVFLVQAPWQSALDGDTWQEPYVLSPDNSTQTLPFPGKESWENVEVCSMLIYTGDRVFDPVKGESYNLDDYANANIQFERRALKDSYTIRFRNDLVDD